LHIDAVERDGSLILKVQGDVDIATAPMLDEWMERATQSKQA
jgi:anti-anti-sigma regulatory factor